MSNIVQINDGKKLIEYEFLKMSMNTIHGIILIDEYTGPLVVQLNAGQLKIQHSNEKHIVIEYHGGFFIKESYDSNVCSICII